MAFVRGRSPQPGYTHLVGPNNTDLGCLEFGLVSLGDAESWEQGFPGREAVLVVLGGTCDFEVGGRSWPQIGQRSDVFDGPPSCVYVPPGQAFRVRGRGEAEIAVCLAQTCDGREAALIEPDAVGIRHVGEGSFRRDIHDIATMDGAVTHRLLVGETYNPPGLWSSYPPHKHDVHEPPAESRLEEVYHFRVKPPQGFGVQRVYGEGFDEAYAVQDRDTVTIPKGYHPVVAAPGYQLYYLWMLAGDERIMHPREDPAHAWIHNQP